MPTTSCGVPSISIVRPTIDAIGREAALPQAVSEHDAAMLSERFFLGEEVAALRSAATPSTRKKSARHEKALHVLGLVLADQVGVPALEAASRSKTSGCRRFISRKSAGETDSLTIDVVRAAVGEQRDAIGVGHRERAQHERVDHLEDGGVGAEAERQRDDNDRAHGRPFEDAAERVSCFETERSHEGISG